MSIAETLEMGHSKTITLRIVKYVGHDKVRFEELMTVFYGKDKKLQQRAAMPLGYVAEGNPRFIEPHLKKLITMLETPGLHAAVARNILRIFQEYDLPEAHHGKLIDICFRFILNPSTPIAIRAFAITTAANIAKPHPDLRREMVIVMKELEEYPQTAALRVRVKNALKTLQAKV